MLKKFLAAALALTMLLTLVCIPAAFADGETVYYAINAGSAKYVTYVQATDPDTGDMLTDEETGNPIMVAGEESALYAAWDAANGIVTFTKTLPEGETTVKSININAARTTVGAANINKVVFSTTGSDKIKIINVNGVSQLFDACKNMTAIEGLDMLHSRKVDGLLKGREKPPLRKLKTQ